MGSIDIIKHLSTVLSSDVNKSQQHLVKNSWECRESNPGLLGEKQSCYLCAELPTLVFLFLFFKGFQFLAPSVLADVGFSMKS